MTLRLGHRFCRAARVKVVSMSLRLAHPAGEPHKWRICWGQRDSAIEPGEPQVRRREFPAWRAMPELPRRCFEPGRGGPPSRGPRRTSPSVYAARSTGSTPILASLLLGHASHAPPPNSFGQICSNWLAPRTLLLPLRQAALECALRRHRRVAQSACCHPSGHRSSSSRCTHRRRAVGAQPRFERRK